MERRKSEAEDVILGSVETREPRLDRVRDFMVEA
jgi:hypothetical protein